MPVELRTLRVEASFDASQYVAGANAKAAADQKMVQSGAAVAGSLTNTDQKLSTTATAFTRLNRAIDPTYAAAVKLEAGTRTLQRALDAGKVSAEEHARLLDLLQKRYAGLQQPINDNNRLMGSAVVSTGQMRFALQNLGFQLNDIATSLASGGSPLRVLAQQGGQVVQVFQSTPGGVSGVMAAAGTAIRGMITPTTAAVAGLAAIAGGFAVLLSRANDNAAMLRNFNLILEGTGKNAVTTATNVQAAARELQRLGVVRSEAEAAQAAILRNPSLNAAQAGAIGTIGANVGARLGLEPVAGIEKFTAAVAGGLESTIKLGFALGALSASEATAARDLARTGQTLQAQNQVIDSIAKNVEGARTKVMGPAAESIKSIGTAWTEMLDQLSDTSAVQGAQNAIVRMIQGIGNAVSGAEAPPLPTKPAGALEGGWIGRQVDTAYFAARAGVVGGARALWNLLPDLGDPRANQLEFAAAQRRRDLEAGGTGDVSRIWAQERVGAVPEGSAAASAARQSIARTAAGLPLPTLGRTGDLDLNIAVRSPEDVAAVASAISKLKKETADDLAIQKLWNIEQDVARARLTEKNRLLGLGASETEAEAGATIAATAARQKANIELGKETTLVEMRIAGENRLAEALKVSASAGAQVAAEEQARIEVRQRGGNVAQRTQEILDEQTAKARVANVQAINTQKEQQEVLQLQVSLQGETSEEITRQVTLLQTKQQLDRESPGLVDSERQARLQAVDATQRQAAALAEAQRNQQRLEDGIRSIANTIDTTLTRSIEDAFSGRQAESWAVRLRSILGSLSAQLTSALFIRPAIGTVLGMIGASPIGEVRGNFEGIPI